MTRSASEGGAGGSDRRVRATADLTSFVGRSVELSRLRSALQTNRLTTLVGPGGVGKTRLALRAAQRNRELFPDGVRVVELAPVGDPDLLATVFVEALNLAPSSRSPEMAVVEHLQDKSLLLVVDNCEHLASDVGEFIEELLCAAPRLRVLATSRQPLAVQSEHLFEVPPLPLPQGRTTVESALAFPAVALFLDRAAAAVPTFVPTDEAVAAVAELCVSLEGIPLAIELAAVRLKVLSIQELGERMSDRLQVLGDSGSGRPTRHQTLRASLDWTLELCTAPERKLWSYGAIYAGGFTVRSLEALGRQLGGGHGAEDLLGSLSGLVDKSVVNRTETDGQVRFRMLETIRQYGAALLESSAERDQVRHAFVHVCRDLVDDLSTRWFDEEAPVFSTLSQEHANIRTALATSLEDLGLRADGLHMAAALWFYWIPRAPAEGRQWLERLLDASRDDEPTPERGHALVALAYLLVMQGDRIAGRALLRAADEIATTFGDDLCRSYVTHVLGLAAFFDGDLSEANELLQNATVRYEELSAPDGWKAALHMQSGLVQIFHGQSTKAGRSFEAAREICEKHGENWLFSYVLYGMAFVEQEAGRPSQALDLLRRCVRLKDPFVDVIGTALVLELVSWIRASQGDGERAGVALGAAGRLWREFGMELYGSATWLQRRRRCEEACAALIGAPAVEKARAHGAELSRQEALAYVLEMSAEAPRPSRARRGASSQPQQESGPHLSRRETQISILVAQGLSNRLIAERLSLSPRTVEGHVQQLLNKLGFTSRAQIAAWVSAHEMEQ